MMLQIKRQPAVGKIEGFFGQAVMDAPVEKRLTTEEGSAMMWTTNKMVCSFVVTGRESGLELL